MHLQAFMSWEDYFQFSYWPEPNTLPGLRCWVAGFLSPAPASLASHLSLAVSLHGWPASVENQTLMGQGTSGGAGGGGDEKFPGGAACTD